MPLWLAMTIGIIALVIFPPLGIPILITLVAIAVDTKRRKEKEK